VNVPPSSAAQFTAPVPISAFSGKSSAPSAAQITRSASASDSSKSSPSRSSASSRSETSTHSEDNSADESPAFAKVLNDYTGEGQPSTAPINTQSTQGQSKPSAPPSAIDSAALAAPVTTQQAQNLTQTIPLIAFASASGRPRTASALNKTDKLPVTTEPNTSTPTTPPQRLRLAVNLTGSDSVANAVDPSAEADPAGPIDTPAPTERMNLTPPAALEVNLKFGDQSANTQQPVSPDATDTLRTEVASPIQIVPVAALLLTGPVDGNAVTSVSVAPPLHTVAPFQSVPASQQGPVALPSNKIPDKSPSLPAAAEPELPKTAAQPPLKSLSLEFTPDGAGDVRVRLSEHAGDVHISLHTTDSSLTQKLSEGVHELAGSLASAGYDAQAWTPDPNSQRQRGQQEQPQPKSRPGASSGPQPDDFTDVLNQNPQEGS